MPWANITLCAACDALTQEAIKSGLATILAETMNKQEQGLAITFTAAFGFYRGGNPRGDAAVVDLRYIGTFPIEVKREVTRRVCGLLEKTVHVDPKKVAVVMTEVASENWGRNAGEF